MPAAMARDDHHHQAQVPSRRLHNPFPPEPKGLTFLEGHLHFDPEVLPSQRFKAGNHFTVSWDTTNGVLSVSHRSEPDRLLWATPLRGSSFLSAALGESTIHESRGSYSLHDKVDLLCTHQTIEDICVTKSHKVKQTPTNSINNSPSPTAHVAVDPDGTALDDDGDVVVVSGWLYSDCETASEELRRHNCEELSQLDDDFECGSPFERMSNLRWFGFGAHSRGESFGVRYRLVFSGKRDHQLGFHLELDDPVKKKKMNVEGHHSRRFAQEPPEELWLWSKEPRSAFRGGLADQSINYNKRWSDKLVTFQRQSLKKRYSSVNEVLGRLTLGGDDDDDDDDDDDVVDDVVPRLNRVLLTYMSRPYERFFGFGEQFSCFDMKGKRVPIMVQEQGLGRGDQPITAAANLVAYRAGGDWHTTYAPSPHYMTSDMNSLYLEGYEHSIFDLTRPDRVQIQVHAESMKGRILHGCSPAELIREYTAAVGRMRELPAWIVKGAIVGMQGGHDQVRKVWKKLEDLDVPLSAFWLQDWVGQRKTSIGWQLWWNWEVDQDHYPGWEKLVDDLKFYGVRTMTYFNPFIVPTDEKANRQSNLFDDAKEKGYLMSDTSGAPYMIPNTSFEAAMMDLTNPETRKWIKGLMYKMAKTGVHGWMADFGESLPFDSCLHSGEDPAIAHNRYPEMWAELNREFIEEWEQEQYKSKKEQAKLNPPVTPVTPMTSSVVKESVKKSVDEEEIFYDDDDDDDEEGEEKLVFFMRAGYRGSPRWATLFWAGDQMVSWQRHDGIKSAVTGLLTSGLSGYAFNHSDIGGYCTVDLPFMHYQRTEELLLRWMELNAFSVIFRTHEGNVPGVNAQFYSNERTLLHFARCAKMYKAWEFYRRQLVKEAAATGMPVIRHLFLHYPDDRNVQALVYQQFLVGSEILVVPVLDKGHTQVQVYFPAGDSTTWEHVWTGLLYRATDKQGLTVWVQAPLGFPAIFVKRGSWIGAQFMHNLIKEGILRVTQITVPTKLAW